MYIARYFPGLKLFYSFPNDYLFTLIWFEFSKNGIKIQIAYL